MDNGSGFRLRRSISRQNKDEDQPDDHHKNLNSSPIKPTGVSSRCTVSGAIALVLRISRVLGIAPLDIEKQESGSWEIRVSKSATIYSIVLISVLNIIALSAVSLDLSVGREHSVRMRNPTKSMIWLTDFLGVILTNNISAYTAPATMRTMIGLISRIQKISSDINHIATPAHIERRLKIMVVFIISLSIAVFVFENYVVTSYSIHNNRNRIIACLYIAYYCLYLNLIFIHLQFFLSVLIIYYALKAFNGHLDRLSHIIKDEGINITEDRELMESNKATFGITVPLKSINIVIDKIPSTSIKDLQLQKKNTAADNIRALGQAYLDICGLIEEVNKRFGIINLMTLLTNLVHLVITPYNLLVALFLQADSNRNIIMQSAWCIKHAIETLLLVEPCHWTYQEFTRTRKLIVQQACRTATAMGPVVVELRKFFWCICLNKMVYAPMGVFTLTRPICAVILGAVTTYLVFVLQFNSKDDDYDR